MDIELIIETLEKRFPGKLLEKSPAGFNPLVKVELTSLRETAAFLKKTKELDFDFLRCVTAVDCGEKIQVIYNLLSYAFKHKLALKVETAKAEAKVPTVSDIWPTAGWHEREAYDLVGVVFEGHADLRRILLPEDWPGHPLSKGYEFPKEYRGLTNEGKEWNIRRQKN